MSQCVIVVCAYKVMSRNRQAMQRLSAVKKHFAHKQELEAKRSKAPLPLRAVVPLSERNTNLTGSGKVAETPMKKASRTPSRAGLKTPRRPKNASHDLIAQLTHTLQCV